MVVISKPCVFLHISAYFLHTMEAEVTKEILEYKLYQVVVPISIRNILSSLRVGRYLTGMVKTCGLNHHIKNRFLTLKCQERQKLTIKTASEMPVPHSLGKVFNTMI